MTHAQLIKDLKKMIGPGIEVDDGGLTVWINDAYMHVIDEIQKVNPDYFTKSASTDLVAEQQEYDLPEDYDRVTMVNVKYDGAWQRALPFDAINSVPVISRSDSLQGFTRDKPYYYIVGDNIGFMPIPGETVTNGLKLWYVYTPTELENDADEPAIPRKYHHILKYGAYANYLDQDDEHVAAERLRQRFDDRVNLMVESISQNQVDDPKSVLVTSGLDLYYDEFND